MGTVAQQCSWGLLSAESCCAIMAMMLMGTARTVFGNKVSEETEKKHRKAESAEILAWGEIQAQSDSHFLPQLLLSAPHC